MTQKGSAITKVKIVKFKYFFDMYLDKSSLLDGVSSSMTTVWACHKM